MALTSCHSSGTRNFDVASKFLECLWIAGLYRKGGGIALFRNFCAELHSPTSHETVISIFSAMGTTERTQVEKLDSVVGITTAYGLGRPGFESRQVQEIFLLYKAVQTVCGAHPASCSIDTAVLSRG